jgi:hypothetical protein
MDFVHSGRGSRDPEVVVRRTLYAGIQNPCLLETALIQKIMATETLCEDSLGLSPAVKAAHLVESYLARA